MKKNINDLFKIGIVVPAMIISMAACGASGTQSASANDVAAAAEGTQETTAEVTEETKSAETQETAADTAAAEVTAEPTVYENKGYKISVPAELADKIIVETPEPGNEDDTLFKAYEKASVEAAKATGHENMSRGLLFGISERNEEDARAIIVNGEGGQEPIAYNQDGVYFIYNHPTDVRYERETVEEMEKDQAEWTAACEWANSVRDSFAETNGLTAISYNGTQVETALARAAYDENAVYTISTLEHGPLEPAGTDPLPFYEKMTTGAKYESIELTDAEKPDGEYVVLNFPEDENRYDFFLAEGSENIIRLVTGPEDGEQFEYYYKVTFADGTSKASEIMHEWYNAIVEANGIQ